MSKGTMGVPSVVSMGLIEQALHFPFQRLGVSDFPLQRLLILMACDRAPDACETSQIMERLPAFTKASMSRHLKALRELGLIEPREVAEDLRRKTWHLTRRGKRFMTDWRSAVSKSAADHH
ncbi:MAG: MarR family winged helix-turn-helix transcriptional regulator [Pseudomonadota bacterium]